MSQLTKDQPSQTVHVHQSCTVNSIISISFLNTAMHVHDYIIMLQQLS